jgi:hypothetical protein
MSEAARFKLNLKSGEIEIEGSEDFVEKQIQTLECLISLIKTASETSNDMSSDISNLSTEESDVKPLTITSVGDNVIPETFGEWLHTFKKDIMDIDKCLITARFIQSKSQTNDFKTSEVNHALKEHGIKLSNPSSSLGILVNKKLLFQTRKVGSLKFFRVSREGQDNLAKLKN